MEFFSTRDLKKKFAETSFGCLGGYLWGNREPMSLPSVLSQVSLFKATRSFASSVYLEGSTTDR